MDSETHSSMPTDIPEPSPRGPSRFTTIAFAAAFVAIGGLIAFAIYSIRPDYEQMIRDRWASMAIDDSAAGIAGESATEASEVELKHYNTIPPVEFTERSGRRVNLSDLSGRVWVANFIFTECRGICPAMTATMLELQNALPPGSDVQLVSITVDPDNDTPEVLAAYADARGADPDRWWFLTANEQTIRRLARDAFMLGVTDGSDPDEPIVHSGKFVLVDSTMTVRGYYDGFDPGMQEQLLADIARLAKSDLQ